MLISFLWKKESIHIGNTQELLLNQGEVQITLLSRTVNFYSTHWPKGNNKC